MLKGLPCVRCPPWLRLMPSTLSPGASSAKYAAMLACEPAMRLHIGMLAPWKSSHSTVTGHVFRDVHKLAAAIVTFARDIPLRIYWSRGCQGREHSGGLQNSRWQSAQDDPPGAGIHPKRDRTGLSAGPYSEPAAASTYPTSPFTYANTVCRPSGTPAAHPIMRLLLLPSGPDRVHTMKSHRTRHHIRLDYNILFRKKEQEAQMQKYFLCSINIRLVN